jgi:hypothetical protein
VNTRQKFERRVVLLISTLILALWAPLTAFSQQDDMHETSANPTKSVANDCDHCKLLQTTNGRPCPHKQDFRETSDIDELANLVGFGEVDPTAQLLQEVAANLSSMEFIVERDYIGFAEADPTNADTLEVLPAPLTVEHSAWQNPVGFAEAELIEASEAVDVIPNEILVICQHMGVSNSLPAAIGVSRFSSLEDQS